MKERKTSRMSHRWEIEYIVVLLPEMGNSGRGNGWGEERIMTSFGDVCGYLSKAIQ